MSHPQLPTPGKQIGVETTADPEHDWADFDCGGGEIHISIYPRPVSG
ncbi:hypothetical protein ACIGD1_34690 [Streptomyces sp. NPDC085612]